MINQDKDSQVLQFVYASVADIAKKCPDLVRSHVPQLVPLMLDSLKVFPAGEDPDYTYTAACNNAAVGLAEFAVVYPELVKPYVEEAAKRIVHAFSLPKVTPFEDLIQNF